MSRLARFSDYRFIGIRDTMVVYDCDDAEEFDELEERVAEDDLMNKLQLQSFAPDNLDEARNRGVSSVLNRKFVLILTEGRRDSVHDLRLRALAIG